MYSIDSLVRQAHLRKDNVDKESCSGLYVLHDSVVYRAVEDWLKVVAPCLVLTDCIQAMQVSLSYSCLVVDLACKRCNRQHLDIVEYAFKSYTIHLYASCGNKWDV